MRNLVNCILVVFLFIASMQLAKSEGIKPLTNTPDPNAREIENKQMFVDGCIATYYIMLYIF